MFGIFTRASLLLAAAATLLATSAVAVDEAHTLPVIYFHGVTANAKSGNSLRQNLESPSRPFVALNFCENECSVRDLPTQVDMAIAQIRAAVANDTRFDKGYVVVSHSQGGILARAVLEEMDDHKAHTLISLAGAQNGNFYGPQPTDFIPTQVFIKSLGPQLLPKTLFDFGNYSNAEVASGKLQLDFINFVNAVPSLQQQLSLANLLRSPVEADWLKGNAFLPAVNNMATSPTDAARRKRNFLRLQAAHFFASPADDVIAPWQTSIFGRYNNVASMAELKEKYTTMSVVPMTETKEYTADTYGLQTLDKRGGLFLHSVDGVGHNCWVVDSTPVGASEMCKFQSVYDQHLAPLIGSTAVAL